MNKPCLLKGCIAAFILLILLLSTVPGCAQTSPKRITAAELNAVLDDRQTVIVDVRETRDWENSDQKIKGAIRLNPASLDPTRLPFAKNAMLVLY